MLIFSLVLSSVLNGEGVLMRSGSREGSITVCFSNSKSAGSSGFSGWTFSFRFSTEHVVVVSDLTEFDIMFESLKASFLLAGDPMPELEKTPINF